MLAQGLHGKVVHALDLAELHHDEVHVARTGALGQLLPWCEYRLHAQARVGAVELADGRAHQRRAAIGPYADAQFAEFQALGQCNVAFQVARDGVEEARMGK